MHGQTKGSKLCARATQRCVLLFCVHFFSVHTREVLRCYELRKCKCFFVVVLGANLFYNNVFIARVYCGTYIVVVCQRQHNISTYFFSRMYRILMGTVWCVYKAGAAEVAYLSLNDLICIKTLCHLIFGQKRSLFLLLNARYLYSWIFRVEISQN